jgi:hypothetical protein
MKAAEKGLVFFKIFDLAFFAPGVVLVLTGAWLVKDKIFLLNVQYLQLGTATGILAVLVGIGAIYAAGLTTFSLTWLVFRRLRRKAPQDIDEFGKSGWPSFALLFKGETSDELILYFWYLRATCFGLASAFLLSGLAILLVRFDDTSSLLIAGIEAVAAVLLALQGRSYDRGVDRGLRGRALLRLAEREQRTTGVPTAPDQGGDPGAEGDG